MVSNKTSTQENKLLHDYELVLIISPEVADEKFQTIIDNLSRSITEKGGATANIERWGRKKLAYPIKRFLEGSYILAKFQMNPAFAKELEANLDISEDVLRHLLVRLES